MVMDVTQTDAEEEEVYKGSGWWEQTVTFLSRFLASSSNTIALLSFISSAVICTHAHTHDRHKATYYYYYLSCWCPSRLLNKQHVQWWFLSQQVCLSSAARVWSRFYWKQSKTHQQRAHCQHSAICCIPGMHRMGLNWSCVVSTCPSVNSAPPK